MNSPPLPSRRSAVAPFIAMDVLREARALERQGRRIVHMELGEPGAPAPRAVREAAERALSEGVIGYAEALGRPDLRRRIARHYADAYGAEISPERVVVTTGSSGAFVLAFLAALDQGARVALTAPGYPAYANILAALGLEPAFIEIGRETRFAPTAAALEAEHRRRRLQAALLASPANPTGSMIDSAEFAKICAFCAEAGILLVSDEIYHGLSYAQPCETTLAHSRHAIVVNSFSKYYAMTGWRLGWLVAPESLVRPIERLQQSLAISAPTLAQIAALEAFEATAELEAAKAGYARSRALMLERLPQLGLDNFAPPDGAFYFYVDVSRFSADAAAFCRRMLEEAGVAATPGIDFDRARGGRAVRFSYAGPEAEIRLGLDRLAAWLGKNGAR
ncbi:aminotransferase class I/II-fold pyridoxal phosphate-dependent enzyme [Methylosinus sp. Sm6]|uniref:aminotransferase class I/II-fold pyridoxal phosphate-dependent enzyme n=1 Tax=Methylosinus sp. Sm6 TaxID=2866948 RepID=UPI001C98F5E1|nr:aminotransferase class I/II-fold pyridoxal phosphate-dependent enzyme [Methylosinus sp. Sm6]MBY6240870.1 aminotransferase class I/II-fold pyridoxal phosphate-dependent enzyme [Methylosinus sp. Sm6]